MKAFSTLNRLPPHQRRNLVILFTTALFFWISITSMLPILPTYIAEIGGNIQQVGLVMGSFAIGLLFSRAWLGNLADKRSRKIVVIIGCVVGALAPVAYLWGTSIPLLVVIRAFHGISIAAFTTGYSALVVDLSPIKQRGEIIGYMSLAVPIGMALGPALGGFLNESVGYPLLFGTCASSGLLALILATLIQESKQVYDFGTTTETKPLPQRSFWQLLVNRALFIPTLILLLVGMLFGTMVSFLPLFVESINLPLNVGLFYSMAAIASFATRVFSGKASDLYGRGVFITFSLACYGIAMVMLTYSSSPELFLLAAIFEGTGAGILIPMLIALISDRSYPHERGKVYSICIGGFDVGIALAGPVVGLFSTWVGYRGMFGIAASFAVIAFILFLSQSNTTLKHSLAFALGQSKDTYAIE